MSIRLVPDTPVAARLLVAAVLDVPNTETVVRVVGAGFVVGVELAGVEPAALDELRLDVLLDSFRDVGSTEMVGTIVGIELEVADMSMVVLVVLVVSDSLVEGKLLVVSDSLVEGKLLVVRDSLVEGKLLVVRDSLVEGVDVLVLVQPQAGSLEPAGATPGAAAPAGVAATGAVVAEAAGSAMAVSATATATPAPHFAHRRDAYLCSPAMLIRPLAFGSDGMAAQVGTRRSRSVRHPLLNDKPDRVRRTHAR